MDITERAWIIGKLYTTIAEYFAHWQDADFTRDQLDDIYKSYLNECLLADDRQAFVSVLKRWIGRLNNAHSWCHDKRGDSAPSLRFKLERIEGGWVVVSSCLDEVVPGDVIETMDGRSPQEWMDIVAPFLSARSQKFRESQWQNMLCAVRDTHDMQLKVRTRNGRIKHITHPSGYARIDTTSVQCTEGRWLTDGAVGYIRIPSFNQPNFEETALHYVKKFSEAKSIIIDLRSNAGGATPGHLIDALMERKYRWWTETSPNIGHLWRRHQGNGKFSIFEDGSGARCESDWTDPSVSVFEGKVIIVAGRYTGSAAEDFIMPFKDTKRGVFIGESTGGSTGQPVFFEHDGVSVGVGSIRAYLPDGTPFEGVGILPDVYVRQSRDDLYQGRDVVLERAIEEAAG